IVSIKLGNIGWNSVFFRHDVVVRLSEIFTVSVRTKLITI
ncbi:hypothetical protein D039_0192B, partial [Vibrio parahaemolyticus EKP-028]